MDKRDKIRTKLLEAQEELDKIDDDYLKLKNELDTKWSFLNDFYRGVEKMIDEKHSLVLSAYSKLPDTTEDMLSATLETIQRYKTVNLEEFMSRKRELERKYDILENCYKKEYQKQEEIIEKYSCELRAYPFDEKEE